MFLTKIVSVLEAREIDETVDAGPGEGDVFVGAEELDLDAGLGELDLEVEIGRADDVAVVTEIDAGTLIGTENEIFLTPEEIETEIEAVALDRIELATDIFAAAGELSAETEGVVSGLFETEIDIHDDGGTVEAELFGAELISLELFGGDLSLDVVGQDLF